MSKGIADCSASDFYVKSLMEEAENHVVTGNHACARAAFCRAVKSDRSGRALNAYGCFLWRTGQLADALACFERLLTLASAGPDSRSVAWNNLAAVHRELGEHAAAAACQQQSMATDASGHADAEPHNFGCDLSNRANDAILSGDYRYAEQLLWLSLEWDVAHGSRADQACDWGNLGILAALVGNTPRAVTRLSKALRLHQAVGDERGVGCDLLHLGEVFEVLGRRQLAIRFLERAIQHLTRAAATDVAEKACQALQRVQRNQLVATFDPSRN